MPELDGVGFVREQMQRRPVPIIIMSIANETAEAALTALDAGAIDFVQKPTALASEKIFEVSTELIEKVKAAGQIQLNRITRTPAPPIATSSETATRTSVPAPILLHIPKRAPIVSARSRIPLIPQCESLSV